jgi:hypothetical protein
MYSQLSMEFAALCTCKHLYRRRLKALSGKLSLVSFLS